MDTPSPPLLDTSLCRRSCSPVSPHPLMVWLISLTVSLPWTIWTSTTQRGRAAVPDRDQERQSIGTLSMSTPIRSDVGPGENSCGRARTRP